MKKELDDDIKEKNLKKTSYKIPLRKINLTLFNELWILSLREIRFMVTNIPQIIMCLLLYSPLSFILAMCSYSLNYDYKGSTTRMGVIAFLLCFISISSALTSIWSLRKEKKFVEKEIDSGYYRSYLYIIVKYFSDVLSDRILQVTILSTVLYRSMGPSCEYWWDCGYKYFIFTYTLILVSLISSSTGLIFATIFHSNKYFNLATINFILLWNSLGGVFINQTSIPSLKWLFDLSFIKYACEILYVNEFSNVYITIKTNDFGANKTKIIPGSFFLSEQGFKEEGIEYNTLVLQGFFLLNCIILGTFYSVKRFIKKIK